MRASDWMTRPVHSCFPHDTLERAAQVMWERGCGLVPVVDAGRRVLGILTDRDICMAAYTRGLRLWQMSAESTMTKAVHAVREQDPLEVVEAVMRCGHVRRVPVLDGDGLLAGILSIDDLARAHRRASPTAGALADEIVVNTVAEICERRPERVRCPEARVVSDLMTRTVHHCGVRDNLHRVAGAMWDNDRGALPVVDDVGRTVAMVTDRDACMAAYTRGEALHQIPVAVAASRAAHSVRADTDIAVAEAVMRMHRVRRLPVLDVGGNLVGVLSLLDILRNARRPTREDDALGYEKVAATLAAVYRPDDARFVAA
jgi:CBS domain-containing protein